MKQLTDIILGHINEVFKNEEELSQERLAVCRKCPLYKRTTLGAICNSELYLNPLTNEVSKSAKVGFKNGCSCRLAAKSRIKDAKCPVGKW